MLFRTATFSDTALILQLYDNARESGNRTGICDWSSDYPNLEILENDLSSRCVFVLEENHKIVASVTLLETDDLDSQPLNWKKVKSCVPVRLCVSPEKQNQGIAKIVVNHLIQYSKDSGYQALRLIAHAGNPAANKLYASLGFTKKGMTFLYEKDFNAYELIIPN